MELYYCAGKDWANNGKDVYIKCVILEDHENYVVAKMVDCGHIFKARHNEFVLSIVE